MSDQTARSRSTSERAANVQRLKSALAERKQVRDTRVAAAKVGARRRWLAAVDKPSET